MSKRIGDVTLIYPENEQECDGCGKIKELRPYGPNGSKVCFNCAMKNPIDAQIQMNKVLFGEESTYEEAKAQLIKMGKIDESGKFIGELEED